VTFPKELTAAYKKAFEAKYPADKLEILNKNTAAGRASAAAASAAPIRRAPARRGARSKRKVMVILRGIGRRSSPGTRGQRAL